MSTLFSEDIIPEINKLAEELRSYSAVDEHLQNKISRYVNLGAYQHYRLNQIYRDYIEKLYKKFIPYLGKKQFLSKFKVEFGQCVFELVIANLLSEKFALQKRSNEEQRIKKGVDKSTPDLKFIFNDKLYFMECTTRYTTLIDKYLESIDIFNLYYQLAEIFSTVFEKKVETKNSGVAWYFGIAIKETFCKMDEKEKSIVAVLIQKLEIKNINDLISKIDEKLTFYGNLYYEFKDILTGDMVEKLEKMIPNPLVSNGPYGGGVLRFLVKSLAVKILEKLKKPYFKEKKPVILAISLSILPNSMKNHVAMNRVTDSGLNIGELLLTELNNIISNRKYTQEKIQELSESLKYLYAVLIDSTWYNWFPSIVEETEGANFGGYKNCYRIIYNQNLAEDLNFDPNLFDSIIDPKYIATSFLFIKKTSAELVES